MAHVEERSHWVREGQIALAGGMLYGISHTISGHPLDNIKAMMQMEQRYRGWSWLRVASDLWRKEGLHAFFRGVMPPLWGSALYRGTMMSVYEASYTYLDAIDPLNSKFGKFLHNEFFAIRPLVIISAVACSVARSVVEAPIEYAKVMRQRNVTWQLSHIYRGAGSQVIRTTSMLVLIFVPYDIIRRNTDWFQRSLFAQWLITTLVCATSYTISWPLETLKNLAQAGLPRPSASIYNRIKFLGGFRGLYIGATPGIICGGFRNGVAMVVMAKYHSYATRLGMRDSGLVVDR
mmetsp:Transcript_16982/g.22005  ORF Transcript_16982/g.22005 Transcript_16982/m.22005 type:complete len:291 (+) Transcript_16982:74-946(+)